MEASVSFGEIWVCQDWGIDKAVLSACLSQKPKFKGVVVQCPTTETNCIYSSFSCFLSVVFLLSLLSELFSVLRCLHCLAL